MVVRLVYSLAVGSLVMLIWACSHQALRADGDDWPAIAGSAQSDFSLRGIERVTPDPLLAEVDPATASHALEKRRREQETPPAASLHDVFFDFDSALLDENGMRTLETNADWLLRHRTGHVHIEGHCDERGSAAYNLVLGEKRAQAIREYLVELGMPAERLTFTSYGEARPVCREPQESCYRENRRGHLVANP